MSLEAGQLLVRDPEKGSQPGQPIGVGDALGDVLLEVTMVGDTAAEDETIEDLELADDVCDVPKVEEMRDDDLTALHCP